MAIYHRKGATMKPQWPWIVTWEIHVDAGTAEEAAQEALRIQRNDSVATVFEVRNAKHYREVETIVLTLEDKQ